MKTISRYSHQGLRGCHACGSTDVQAVCHHCGRPLCGAHVAAPLAKEPSIEFMGLRTDPAKAGNFPAPVHCAECVHFVRRPNNTLMAWGGAVAGIGAVIALGKPVVGIPIGLAGIGLAAYGWFRKKADRAEHARRRPVFPVSDVEI